MTTTVKLPPELEHQLRQRSTQEGRSISELMRDALSAYLQNVPPPRASAFSLGADLFGRHAGPADLSTDVAAIWPMPGKRNTAGGNENVRTESRRAPTSMGQPPVEGPRPGSTRAPCWPCSNAADHWHLPVRTLAGKRIPLSASSPPGPY